MWKLIYLESGAGIQTHDLPTWFSSHNQQTNNQSSIILYNLNSQLQSHTDQKIANSMMLEE